MSALRTTSFQNHCRQLHEPGDGVLSYHVAGGAAPVIECYLCGSTDRVSAPGDNKIQDVLMGWRR